MKNIQELKFQLADKQDGFAGLDEVATGLLIVGVIVVAGFIVLGTMEDLSALHISGNLSLGLNTDEGTAINDTKDGLGNLTTFFGIIAIVAALTVVIVLLRRASGAMA